MIHFYPKNKIRRRPQSNAPAIPDPQLLSEYWLHILERIRVRLLKDDGGERRLQLGLWIFSWFSWIPPPLFHTNFIRKCYPKNKIAAQLFACTNFFFIFLHQNFWFFYTKMYAFFGIQSQEHLASTMRAAWYGHKLRRATKNISNIWNIIELLLRSI